MAPWLRPTSGWAASCSSVGPSTRSATWSAQVTGQWYEFLNGAMDMDVVYNIGDAINKIGFGLVIYALAVKDSNS